MSDLHTVTNPDTGEEMAHYEWSGWMWCENEQEAFDFERKTCPYCEVEL